MKLAWFKMWSEARNDAKLRRLTDAAFRAWFNLLCYSAEQPERGTIRQTSRLIAVEVCEGDDRRLAAAVAELEALGLVAVTEGPITEITFPAFQGRNLLGDGKPSASREAVRVRVARYRARKKMPQLSAPAISRAGVDCNAGNAPVTPLPVTPGNAPCNAHVTPSTSYIGVTVTPVNDLPDHDLRNVTPCNAPRLEEEVEEEEKQHPAGARAHAGEVNDPQLLPEAQAIDPALAEAERVGEAVESLFPRQGWGLKALEFCRSQPPAAVLWGFQAAFDIAVKDGQSMNLGRVKGLIRHAMENPDKVSTARPNPAMQARHPRHDNIIRAGSPEDLALRESRLRFQARQAEEYERARYDYLAGYRFLRDGSWDESQDRSLYYNTDGTTRPRVDG